MPANVQNAKNFLLTTDFPLDKVIYLYSGSVSLTGTSNGQVTIPHNLPFTPLIGGSWALDSSFSTTYEYASGTFPSSNTGISYFQRTMNIEGTSFGNLGGADEDNIYISWINNGSTIRAYYRIYAFEPPDSNFDLEPTASSGDPFVFNTDYNYTKLYLNDQFDVGTGPITYEVDHDLGYIPQVSVWSRVGSLGLVGPVNFQYIDPLGPFGDFNLAITDTQLTFDVGAANSVDLFGYRIYLDDNA